MIKEYISEIFKIKNKCGIFVIDCKKITWQNKKILC